MNGKQDAAGACQRGARARRLAEICRASGFGAALKAAVFKQYAHSCRGLPPDAAVMQFARFRKGILEIDLFVPEAPAEPPQDELAAVIENSQGKTVWESKKAATEFRFAGTLTRGFRFRILLGDAFAPGSYAFVSGKGAERTARRFVPGDNFPISAKYRNAYFTASDGRRLSISRDGRLRVARRAFFGNAIAEFKFCLELLRNRSREECAAVVVRTVFRISRVFRKKRIWIFSDKLGNPYDSAYAIAHALIHNRRFAAEKIRAEYVVLANERRAGEIAKTMPCVRFLSLRHILHHLAAEVNATSEDGCNPFAPCAAPYADLLARQMRVSAIHGIIHHDLSRTYGKDRQNFELMILGVNRELEYLKTGLWHYDDDELAATGMPRWDFRQSRPQKMAYFIFSWRANLVESVNPLTKQRVYGDAFAKSEFCRRLSALLSAPAIHEAARKHGYTLCFVPHPLVRPAMRHFNFPGSVQIFMEDKRYEDIYADASMLVTDFSSVAMDMAYLGKPVVYYQFDKEEFYATQGYTESFYSWEEDGFGQVVNEESAAVDCVVRLLENGCAREKMYDSRVKAFFPKRDGENGVRACEAILEKLKNRNQNK
jgi:Putative glycosyl/glycerophosphate transferases involved in teichoic acid biosynthesis TagF/TagB/EpsJ/RodC